MSDGLNNYEKMQAQIRETPLLVRLEQARKMIFEMCRGHRVPKITVPKQPTDEDIFIMVTIMDAADQIEKQKQRIAELTLGVLPDNLDVSKVAKYWHQRAEEAENKLQEKQVEHSQSKHIFIGTYDEPESVTNFCELCGLPITANVHLQMTHYGRDYLGEFKSIPVSICISPDLVRPRPEVEKVITNPLAQSE